MQDASDHLKHLYSELPNTTFASRLCQSDWPADACPCLQRTAAHGVAVKELHPKLQAADSQLEAQRMVWTFAELGSQTARQPFLSHGLVDSCIEHALKLV